jgi:peptide deformylase
MNKYELVYFPNENLYKPTTSVLDFNNSLNELLDSMKNIMLTHKGLGISSNQCGASLSCFLLRQVNGDILDIINPEIIETTGKQIFNQEGCLSAPGIFVSTTRSQQIEFKYQDRTGEHKVGIVEGIEAVIFEHELEHLKGEVFLSKTTRPQRKLALSKMRIK